MADGRRPRWAPRATSIEVMVRDDAQVRDVVGQLLTTARPGTVIAVHSTIRAETAEELAVTAAEHGRRPARRAGERRVHGRRTTARSPRWSAASARPTSGPSPCSSAGPALVVHMGPVGAGTRTKLARNLMHFIAYTAAGEAQRLAEAAGLDLRKLARVVRHTDAVTGGPGAIMVRDTTAPMAPDDGLYEIFAHTRELGEKDLTLALELADGLGLDLPLAKQALEDFGPSLGLPR